MDKGLVRTFVALGDPVRMITVQVLAAGPRSAGDLARHASVSPSVMSRHLRTLQEARIITMGHDSRDARRRVFALEVNQLHAAGAWMDQVQSQWNEQLASFRTHVESEPAR